MAMTTVCSTSNPSPTLPTVSLSSLSSSKSSSLKIPHHHLYTPPHLSSSSKLNLDLDSISTDASSIAALSVSVSVTDDALALARESLASAFEAAEQRRGHELEERDWRNGCLVRRRKRRKRRKGVEFERCDDEDKFSPLMAATATSKPGKYLTTQEEAQYSMYMREEARLESVRWKILESSEHEPTTRQWAKAAGMKGRNLDKAICSGKEAQERVIRCYRRLIVSIASSYQGKGLSLQDLIQEGSIGLICGIKKFDPKKGYKLSTYIYYWIRQSMIKAVAEKSRIIRLPGNICAKLPKLAEANSILSRRLRRLPSHDELAEATDMDVATVRLISQRIRSPISVDQPFITNHGCMTLQDIIPGPKETTPEAMVKRQHMKQDLEKLLTTLCDREAIVLRLYYGLNGDTAQSYEEIGKLLKISRERVRQLRRIALSKLQHSSMVENLKVYLM